MPLYVLSDPLRTVIHPRTPKKPPFQCPFSLSTFWSEDVLKNRFIQFGGILPTCLFGLEKALSPQLDAAGLAGAHVVARHLQGR